MKHKICYQCKNTYPLSKFKSNDEMTDGHINLCDTCRMEYHRNYYQLHKERARELQQIRKVEKAKYLREYNKQYYSKNKDKLKEYLKGWYKKNREQQAQKARQYYKDHTDKVKSTVKAYRQSHPEVDKIHAENRRFQKLGAGDRVTTKEWTDLVQFYNYTCVCCGRNDVRLTQDHVVPLKLGGRHIISNIQPLCRSCNSKKHTKIIDYRIDTVSDEVEDEQPKKTKKK